MHYALQVIDRSENPRSEFRVEALLSAEPFLLSLFPIKAFWTEESWVA